MNDHSHIDVSHEVWIDAPPDAVFEYFADADLWQRWQAAAADVDARVGGNYRVAIAESTVAIGEFLEMVRPSRLVMTWGWEGHDLLPPGSSVVEVDFIAEESGTRVRLSHRGLPEPEKDNMAEGWKHYLGRLSVAASGGDPGPDPWTEVMA